ncbi:MAG: TlpA family protein disulfide reductase [Aquitalea sp.]|nr:TlpA family protein disulfide reductase [Aquitalea sp.]
MQIAKRPLLLLAALLGMLSVLPARAATLEVGQPVPSFSLHTLQGQQITAEQLRGQVVVINLWATWCSYCREEMPALQSYYQRHHQQGLQVFAVSMDEASEDRAVRDIMQQFAYTGAIGRDSKLSGFGRIWRLPMTFVIDRKGILRRDGSVGSPTVDAKQLEAEVTPWLAEH